MTARPVNPTFREAERAVGWRVEQRRRQLGLTRAALAQRLDLTVAQLGKLINGQSAITAGRMSSLAAALSTTVTELYSDDNYVRLGHRYPRGENELMTLFAGMTELNRLTLLGVARIFAQRETR